MEKFALLINKIGILLLSILVNNIFASILILPIFLISIFFDNQITNYILPFSLLMPLFGLALEGLSFSYHEIFVNDKKYYKNHFFKELKKNFLRKYLFYFVLFFVSFYGTYSLNVMKNLSPFIGFLFYLMLFIWINVIFFTILQISLREKIGFKQVLVNSLILTIKYFYISLINFLISFIYINFTGFNILSIYLFLNIFAFGMVFINKYI